MALNEHGTHSVPAKCFRVKCPLSSAADPESARKQEAEAQSDPQGRERTTP